MRYAILADIHANLEALTAVLEDIGRRDGVDEYVCLGDIVGYGPDPHQCIEMARGLNGMGVAGNHDLAAIGKIDTSEFNPYAAAAVNWTKTQLTAEDISYLGKLPQTTVKGGFTVTHGSPRDPVWEYLLSTLSAAENFIYFRTPLCFVGHSHVPVIYELDQNGECRLHRLHGQGFKLTDNRYIINPGGIGQPRDGDPRASYAVYDSRRRTVSHYRVPYAIPATQAKMRARGLPEMLVTRLSYGE